MRSNEIETVILEKVGTIAGNILKTFLLQHNLWQEVQFDQSCPDQLKIPTSVIEAEKALEKNLGKLSPDYPFKLRRENSFVFLSLGYESNPNYVPPRPQTEGLMTPDQFMKLYQRAPQEIIRKIDLNKIVINGSFEPKHDTTKFLPDKKNDFYGVSPLILAAFWGKIGVVQMLLESHAYPLSLTSGTSVQSDVCSWKDGRSQFNLNLVNNPILQAAERSYIDVATAIFNHVRQNRILSETEYDNYGRTLLMFAAMVGDTTAIIEILDYNRNNIQYLTKKDNSGSCALAYALKLGHLESAKSILYALKLASVNENIEYILSELSYDTKPISALFLSAHDPELFQFLVAEGANVFQRTDSGLSVLDAVVKSNNIDSVQLILSKIEEGNREDARQKMLDEALFSTVRDYNDIQIKLAIFDLLVDQGANVNARDTQNVSLLGSAVAAAVRSGLDTEGAIMLEAILHRTKMGLNECCLHSQGDYPGNLSPLMLVTTCSQALNSPILDVLFNAGADVRVKNKRGENALVLTVRRRYYFQYCEEQQTLMTTYSKRILKAMNAAEETAPSSPHTDKGLETALYFAACSNNTQLVNLLLEAGADVHAEIADEYSNVKTVLAHLEHKDTYSSHSNPQLIETVKVIKQWISTHPLNQNRVKKPIERIQEEKKRKMIVRCQRRVKRPRNAGSQNASAGKTSIEIFSSGVDQGADLGGQPDTEAPSAPSASA